MGSRTYSPDRKVAAAMVTATVEGYLDAGIIPAVKHFPGLGTVTGDSHHSLPEQGKSLAQLRRTDLVTVRGRDQGGRAGDHDRPRRGRRHRARDAGLDQRRGRAGAAARHPRLPRRRGHRLAGHGPDQRPVQLGRGRGAVAARRQRPGAQLAVPRPGPAGRAARGEPAAGCPRTGSRRRRRGCWRCGSTSSASPQPADPPSVPRGTRSTSSRCLADRPSPLDTPRSRRPTHGAR